VKDFFSLRKKHFILYYFITFLVILTCNLMGMFPYSFAITSHFNFTFFMSLSFFYGLMIIAIRFKNIFFFSIFYPSGVPVAMLPLLIPIEIISYYSRIFSLAIRLFANIMSGHILVKILSLFA
jgi:ATP synthase subunit 6